MIRKLILSAALVVAVAGCKSRPTQPDATDAGAGSGSDTPTVDSTPMSFDASGSDSGKIAGLVTVQFEYDKSSLSGEAKKKIAGSPLPIPVFRPVQLVQSCNHNRHHDCIVSTGSYSPNQFFLPC